MRWRSGWDTKEERPAGDSRLPTPREGGGFGTPRGGVFVSEEPGNYTLSTPYELFGAAGSLDWYVPLGRRNVILWTAV